MPNLPERAEVKSGAGRGLSARRHWFLRAMRIAWRGLREWCGDSAYELYLRSKAGQSSASRTLSPAEFYVEQLDRRYSRPNRCC
jgi:uncharacterized short protein YbdD (DUF466 family)